MNASEPAFRVGFVPGVTPDKWARIWAERMPRRPLDLVPLGDRDGVALVRSGELAMCFVRLPVDREGLHLIPLYDEQPVVVVAKEHPVAAYDEIDVTDLADEHLLQDPDDVPEWRDVATEVARRHPLPGAGDVAARRRWRASPPTPASSSCRCRWPGCTTARTSSPCRSPACPTTKVGLTWLVDDDDDRVQTFIGVVRGRSATSSRR